MKKQLLFMLMCLISALSGWAGVQVVLPWGANEPWEMKYVMQPSEDYFEPANDGAGHAWTQLGYNDSGWHTLTGPMANGTEDKSIYFFKNFTWEGENNSFNLRRTFKLDAVNSSGYTFATMHDDGIEVYINGNKVYNRGSHTDGNIVTTHVAASVFQEGVNQIAIYFYAGSFGHNYLDYALFVGNDYNNGLYDGLDINGLRYWFNDDGKTARVVGINEGVQVANIPSSITVKGKEYPVTTIGRYAFASSELTLVSIPSTITRIGENAFSECNVERVDITDLEAWCRIDFEGDNYSGYGSNPLCTGDGKLYLNNSRVTSLEIPESITKIKDYAFTGGKFSSLIIPNTVTSIGVRAFYRSSTLRTATINDAEGSCALTSIGYEAFGGCSSLNSINFTQYPSEIGEGAFGECALTSVELGNLTTISNGTFSGCGNLITINIPSSVTTIGDGAFGGCGSLSIDLILPEGLTTIGNDAFAGCSKVERLHLPNTLTTIGDNAFNGLSRIKSLYIPSSVTSIGHMAFVGLRNAVSIVVSEDNPKYDSRNNCNAIIEVGTGKLLAGCRNTIIPDGTTSLEEAALAWLPNTIFIVPNTVKEIKKNAFGWCRNFGTLVLGCGTIEVGEAIHYDCVPGNIYCYATEVPLTHGRAFVWGGPDDWQRTLHVPAESIEKYRTTAPWNVIPNIVPITGDEQFTYDLYLCESFDNSTRLNRYNGYDANVTLDRTFHKDGKWNTLCLPFSMTAEQIEDGENPLHDATIVKMEPASSSLKADGTLDITFVRTAIIEAGKPYLVRWKEGDDLVDPTFKSVHLSCTEPTAIEFDNEQGTDPCKFVGQFSPFKVTDENIDRIVQLSPDGQPYYSPEPETLYSSHAHFEIPGLIKSSNFSYRGDVNNDGEVDLSDAIMVTYYSLHEVPSNFNESAADLNGDGDIDLSDAIIIIYISLGVK